MADSPPTIERRLRHAVGTAADVDTDAMGKLRVAPHTAEACALILETAHDAGWAVRPAGGGGWLPPNPAVDLTLTTRALTTPVVVRPADLIATAPAGIDRTTLQIALADHGMWWPVDPPGHDRTVGSIVATATAGPLRSGLGGIRDHVLGTTVVTADGRVIRSGVPVVKNVAGFDLAKLATGSFGAFGVIAAAHLRLRTLPRADLTLTAVGGRDALLELGREVLDTGVTPAALEVYSSPTDTAGPTWRLLVRLLGSEETVDADRTTLHAVHPAWTVLRGTDAAGEWELVAAQATAGPVTVRMGAALTGLDRAADLFAHHLDDARLSISVSAGALRWCGTAEADRIRLLRHAAAQVEMPLTVERAPWPLLLRLGHFGAYREGVGRITDSLRRTFDPKHTLVVPVTGE